MIADKSMVASAKKPSLQAHSVWVQTCTTGMQAPVVPSIFLTGKLPSPECLSLCSLTDLHQMLLLLVART